MQIVSRTDKPLTRRLAVGLAALGVLGMLTVSHTAGSHSGQQDAAAAKVTSATHAPRPQTPTTSTIPVGKKPR
jgi:hypothetical protein